MKPLNLISSQIRLTLCDISSKTKTPHLGSCLSCVDILTALYWHALNIDPANPADQDRDYFLLGKGHAASALYTTLAYRGFFPIDNLYHHGKDNTPFEEHSGINSPAGVESISGSLGHALSTAAGMALAQKIKNKQNKFYVLMGDGEINEGTVWEAAMFSSSNKLSNLVAIIDFNKLQGTGRSCDIMHLEPLHEKWTSFGWNTIRVNGHDPEALKSAFDRASNSELPTCIIADTIKGAGVSFMEDDNNWHYRVPTSEEVAKAAIELGVQTDSTQ